MPEKPHSVEKHPVNPNGLPSTLTDLPENLEDAEVRCGLSTGEVLSWRQDIPISAKPEPAPQGDTRSPDSTMADICCEDGGLLTQATIIQISQTGAYLQIAASKMLPQRLILRTALDRPDKAASLKWINGKDACIEFDDMIDEPGDWPSVF